MSITKRRTEKYWNNYYNCVIVGYINMGKVDSVAWWLVYYYAGIIEKRCFYLELM